VSHHEPESCLARPQVFQPNRPHSSESSSNWHDSFSIPDLNCFSPHVRDAVNNGIITDKAKREIHQVLRTYITAYMLYPTSEQYTTVCKKLVQKYPVLCDDAVPDGSCKYVRFIEVER